MLQSIAAVSLKHPSLLTERRVAELAKYAKFHRLQLDFSLNLDNCRYTAVKFANFARLDIP